MIVRDVVLGLGPWSLVVHKDKISVLGPGLELQVLGSVILSQQASLTMVWKHQRQKPS